MLKAVAGFVVGYQFGERHAAEAAPSGEGGGAMAWLASLLILLAIVKFGHVDLRPHARLNAHGVVTHAAAPR
jgi:hypothetical protein